MIRRVKCTELLALAFSLSLAALPGWAFELRTHEGLTRAAFGRSKVADTLRDLGIDPVTPLNGGFLRGSHSPVDWLVQGVQDEDDIFSIPPARFQHHFYDPVHDRGLTTSLVRGERAPDWALEDRQEFPTQKFSYRDARQAFLAALTERVPGDREEAMARTFEILGHVIHLVQDMASPPHTRNDSHGGFIFGPSSLYEGYLDQPQVLARLNVNGSPVRLALPRHYWITGDGRGVAEFVNQNFVSEGTNFTARLHGAIGGGYPSPVLRLGRDEQGRPFEVTLNIQTELEPGLRDRNGNLIDGSVTFFANNFRDPITGQALRNERMTTLSLFDRDLERRGGPPLFALNRYNIEAQAAFLIPRAVGYSAGLLDYFFRGRLEVDLVPSAAVPGQVELRVINRSAEAIGPGTVFLYFDDAAGVRCPVPSFGSQPVPEAAAACPPGNGALPVAERVQPNTELPRVAFARPAGSTRLILVYRGTLGNEVPVPNTDPTRDFPGAVIGKVFGESAVEVAFIGTVNGHIGFYLATDQGLFRIPVRDQASFLFQLESISWGANDNVLLIAYRPNPLDAFSGVFQIHRINRPRGRNEIPVQEIPDPQTGLQFVDTTVLAEFLQLPNFPIGTVTAKVDGIAHRRLIGTISDFRGGTGSSVTTFNPFAEDTLVVPFVASHEINLNVRATTLGIRFPYFVRTVHAFVDENDELIGLYEFAWSPSGLIASAGAKKVRALGVLPPPPRLGAPFDPDGPCTGRPVVDRTLPDLGSPGAFNAFLSPTVTEICSVLFAPGLDFEPALTDYALVNLSTAQTITKSFDNPTFTWGVRIEVLTGFEAALTRIFGGPGSILVLDRLAYQNFIPLYTTADPDAVTAPTRSGIFNFQTSGRGLWGITVEPPYVITPFTETKDTFIVAGVDDQSWTRFRVEKNPEERALEANADQFFRQVFPLRNRGRLVLQAVHREGARVESVNIVSLPITDPTAAGVLAGPFVPPVGFSFTSLISANRSAAVVILRRVDFESGLPVEKALLITGDDDAVREILPENLPADLQVLLPNSFIDETEGHRKELKVQMNGTVTFTATATPEQDLLAASTFPNVTTLQVKPFEHKPQWHALGR